MKKSIIAALIICATILSVPYVRSASAKPISNPAQFPYSFFQQEFLSYMGSNTGSESGVPCMLEATGDNMILAWFQGGNFSPDAITSATPYCVAVYPNNPSEVVNTAEYLSSSQKNFIDVRIEEGYCEFMRLTTSIKPAADGFYWSDHLPGLTTATANPVVGISMVKLQDAAIADPAGFGYETIANALFAAGFKLDKKGFWVNQCYGGPFLQTLEH